MDPPNSDEAQLLHFWNIMQDVAECMKTKPVRNRSSGRWHARNMHDYSESKKRSLSLVNRTTVPHTDACADAARRPSDSNVCVNDCITCVPATPYNNDVIDLSLGDGIISDDKRDAATMTDMTAELRGVGRQPPSVQRRNAGVMCVGRAIRRYRRRPRTRLPRNDHDLLMLPRTTYERICDNYCTRGHIAGYDVGYGEAEQYFKYFAHRLRRRPKRTKLYSGKYL